jgi:hypothetical protein
MTKQRKLEFKENRTSWKWFANRFEKQYAIRDALKTPDTFTMRLLMEILKELQYLNDKPL